MYRSFIKYIFAGIVFLLVNSLHCFAIDYTVENLPNPKTVSENNYVSNPDNILNQQTVTQINEALSRLESDTNSEVAVVAVNSIGKTDIEVFKTLLFEKWGIGKDKSDNGLLIILVEGQRAVSFEVGYGLEGVLTDGICKRIQLNYMLPEFKKGDYDAGMLRGVEETVKRIENEEFVVAEEKINWSVVWPIVIAIYLVYITISCIWIVLAGRKIKGNKELTTNFVRYYEMKKYRLRILIIMGFIIPGITVIFTIFYTNITYAMLSLIFPFLVVPAWILASGLMRKYRRAPFACNVCGGMTHILTEKEEDLYLSKSQQLEEMLKSIDHDVFLCDNCNNITIYSYDKKSIYSKCPRCGTKSFYKESKKIISQPTERKDGVERTIYHCKSCGYRENKDKKIPRTNSVPPVVILPGGGGRSGGGFGGFGGGSFGGGHSGGGGATSRW